ncbi:uncharacterized protein [Euphorbia lathyris]|uniref:uncharacterized protein n=1 Tax=Euphorbia lathyris TaxID=212925 RepID=UPI003313652F
MTRKRKSYVDALNSSQNIREEDLSEPEGRSESSDSTNNRDSDSREGEGDSMMNSNSNSSTVNNSNDNPGLVIVSTILNGSNYIPWRRSMLLALSAKRKSNHILQDEEPADKTSDAYKKWKWENDLVFSWIINAMSRDLADVFLYAPTARKLWTELEERYGESNGPLIFQLRREICSLNQGGMSLVDFFNKMKRMWDEYAIVKPPIACSCEARKLVQEQVQEEQLMQFLSGLNPEFDHVRDQILLMDPLPPVNRAYSMLIRIEKQRILIPLLLFIMIL